MRAELLECSNDKSPVLTSASRFKAQKLKLQKVPSKDMILEQNLTEESQSDIAESVSAQAHTFGEAVTGEVSQRNSANCSETIRVPL